MTSFLNNENIDWVDILSETGYVVLDDIFTEDQLNGFTHVFGERLEEDRFKKAAIGSQDKMQIKKEIRGDNIFWLDKNKSDSRLLPFFTMVDSVKDLLNRYCFLSLSDYEFHFAHYPPGTYYLKHLDQFQGRNNRLISLVFYLNKDWKKGDGGELKLYSVPDDKIIEPQFGRMVLFKSADVKHEVLLTNRDRYSITGWMLYNKIGLEFF